MAQDQAAPRRKRIRWSGFQYGGGAACFVTICTEYGIPLLASVDEAGNLHETSAGNIVRATWDGLSNRFPLAHLDAIVVMPDHIHAVLTISGDPDEEGDEGRVRLSPIVGAMKSLSATQINRERGVAGLSVWQTRFHDRVIRDEDEFAHLC